MTSIHFVAGMPRSGSTLLCNILSQNPRFRATGTSPLPALMSVISQTWNNSNECKANYTDEDKHHLLRSVMSDYHLPFNRDVIFDKSRAWPAYIELLQQLLNRDPKIIVCARHMAAICSSFEKLWRKEVSKYGGVSQAMITLEDRLKFWTSNDQVVGSAYRTIEDAVQRGHRNLLHVVDFYSLTTDPRRTLMGIHQFLEEPWFEYDFDNVEQVIHEKDEFHGFSKDALHTIRPQVKPVEQDFEKILGKSLSDQLGIFDYAFLQ